MPDTLNSGYSPRISMELQVGTDCFAIASLGGDKMILRDAKQVPACTGEVRITVDGDVTIHQVALPDGIEPTRRHQTLRVIRPDVTAVA